MQAGTPAKRVALVYQPLVDAALPLVQRCVTALEKLGVESQAVSSWELGQSPPATVFDLVLTFGGDGTILRAARWLEGCSGAIVGVQMGRLGFLAELQPKEVPDQLEPILLATTGSTVGSCFLPR